MPSADQVPVKSPHSTRASESRTGCRSEVDINDILFCEDDVHAKSDEFRGELRKTFSLPFRVPPLNEQVFAFDVAEFAEPLLERSK